MSVSPEAIARMYPTMQPTESPTPVRNPGEAVSASPATGVMTGKPSGDAVFEQSHPKDMAARRYPKMEQPDPVAQKIADEINGESPAALVESVPENVAKLREGLGNKLTYPAHYDVALGISTKELLNGKLPADQVLVRNSVAGMANDMGLDASDLNTIVNQARAAKAGKPLGVAPMDDIEKADALALISRDPRVSALVEHLQISNDPISLRIFARAAREQRTKGRLK